MKKIAIGGFILLILIFTAFSFFSKKEKFIRVLVFSKTEGYRHESISAGKKAILSLGSKHGFQVDTTEDATMFDEKTLKKYNVVVFLSTTGDVLNGQQEQEFRRFIQAGGGFVGIHAAADTEYEWPWYGKLVGAYFESHPNDPNVRQAEMDVVDDQHISTEMLPKRWKRNDEWYNYKKINPDIKVLLKLDEKSYQGGTNGNNHPIAWAHEMDGGRAWYTGLGHTPESFSEEKFIAHLWGGIQYAAGEGKAVDYSKPTVTPLENRFQKTVLESNLFEPMELELLPDRSILYVQRRGEIRRYDPKKQVTETIYKMPVHTKYEDGLLGMALDPNFQKNNWIYFFYSPVGDVPKQHVSRFTMNRDYTSIDIKSEKVLLEIKTQRDECCHSGGSLEFGPGGLLYISVGDNTNPFASEGFAPIDEREGRSAWDAQRSSANTQDLRGKVLRIKPNDNGTYSIPEGNLFKNKKEGRPEIYVMGCRNPFRIAIDKHTNYLYWGDVGPDANNDSTHRGYRGHDEVNQARKAGFFGWPYFVGNNKAYVDFDFNKRKPGKSFNPAKPINNSPNNTGLQELPPAQPAYIWYPYAKSDEFPLTGTGGRNAMAAGVYYYDDYTDNPGKFPQYYDKKLFTYDWIRGWMMAVTMDEEGNMIEMERFLPSYKFSNPVDIIFSPEGDMYMLEYGSGWFSQNPDARLVHITYNSGNRKPLAKITYNQQFGSAPFTVSFSAESSSDSDHDNLTYAWYFGSKKIVSTDSQVKFTFDSPGKKYARLVVTDAYGEKSEDIAEIFVGNAFASIDWAFAGNRTFYWDNQKLNYAVKVSDPEDEKSGLPIKPQDILVSIDYLEQGFDLNAITLGHQQMQDQSTLSAGEKIMEESDCKSCHKLNQASVGPSYIQIAEKYKGDDKAMNYLSNKIIQGGGGVWGETAMAAHPGISQDDARQIVAYIFSLTDQENAKASLPSRGSFVFDQHLGKGFEGKYVLTASYTDQGGQEIGPLTSTKRYILRNPMLMAAQFDATEKTSKYTLEPGTIPGIDQKVDLIIGVHESYVMYKNIDLTDIKALMLTYSANPRFMAGGTIEFRLDKPTGTLWASKEIKTSEETGPKKETMPVKAMKGEHDLYVVFKSKDSQKAACGLFSMYFMNNLPQ
ncbi:MAG: ThuA domain-containing protein [Microscillaceae bacterium]|nr:ThuA domain-containing protein [Microscillaceae bacterium]